VNPSYKLEFGVRHLAMLFGAISLVVVGAIAIHFWQLKSAESHVRELQALAASQKAKLKAIDAKAGQLSSEIRRLEKQNAEIRRAIGIQTPGRRATTRAVGNRRTTSFRSVEFHLARVAIESERARTDSVELRGLVTRVLNLRRLETIARVQMLARIPSLVPAGNGEIASTFGYRTVPYPEFHRGVDLEADYGDTVRAAAKGVVAFAGWDGGYGKRIDIDHGNGLHTWYCHLSRIGVHEGESVTKGEPIAAVGSTGEATGPHLHYQVMRNGNPVDPTPFLLGQGARVLGLGTFGPRQR
jgi:murein DD-endopeptidase MepM/ murein hydrolase activator NlpD